jgi:hypothetical protein
VQPAFTDVAGEHDMCLLGRSIVMCRFFDMWAAFSSNVVVGMSR